MHPEFIFKFLNWSQKLSLKKVHLQLGVLRYIHCLAGDSNQFTNHLCSTNRLCEVSDHLLPHIPQPTRVYTDHSATIMDNIFTNANEYDTISGNILNRLANHFPVFNNEEHTCCPQTRKLLQT